MDNKGFMQRAKQALAGAWLMAALGTLVYTLILGASGFTYVLELVLAGPLLVGYVRYLMRIVDNDDKYADFNLLFSGFQRFGENLVAGLLYTLAVGLGCILLIVPGIIAACGFGMTFYILAEDNNIRGVDALSMSWNMMKGHKWDFFCLNFRFIGWALLCILTFGIGSFFLQPYMQVAGLYFYRQLRYNTY